MTMNATTTNGADEHAHALMRVAGRLIALMRQEVDMLHDMRIRDIEALQPDKDSLAADYCRLTQDLRQDEDSIRALPESLKAELRLLEAQFAKAAEENQMALKAAMDANTRLFEIVATAVRDQQVANSQYSANGRRDASAAAGAPASLSLNQTL